MISRAIQELENIVSYSKEPVERLMGLISLSETLAEKDFLRSWILANEAINEAKRTNNRRLLGKAYMLSANSLWKLADYTESREHYHLALEIYEEQEEMMGVARAYCGIGIIYGELDDYEMAEEAFEKAVEASKAAGNEVFAATNMGNLGHVNLRYGNLDKAFEYFYSALEVYETVTHMEVGKANMYAGIAGVKVTNKKYQEGIDYLQKSINIHRSEDNKRGLAVGLRNMGEIHYRIGNLGGALKFLNESLELCEKINFHSQIAEVHQILARTYSESGDETSSRRHTNLYQEAERIKKREKLQLQEEMYEKQKELDRLRSTSEAELKKAAKKAK